MGQGGVRVREARGKEGKGEAGLGQGGVRVREARGKEGKGEALWH